MFNTQFLRVFAVNGNCHVVQYGERILQSFQVALHLVHKVETLVVGAQAHFKQIHFAILGGGRLQAQNLVNFTQRDGEQWPAFLPWTSHFVKECVSMQLQVSLYVHGVLLKCRFIPVHWPFFDGWRL